MRPIEFALPVRQIAEQPAQKSIKEIQVIVSLAGERFEERTGNNLTLKSERVTVTANFEKGKPQPGWVKILFPLYKYEGDIDAEGLGKGKGTLVFGDTSYRGPFMTGLLTGTVRQSQKDRSPRDVQFDEGWLVEESQATSSDEERVSSSTADTDTVYDSADEALDPDLGIYREVEINPRQEVEKKQAEPHPVVPPEPKPTVTLATGEVITEKELRQRRLRAFSFAQQAPAARPEYVHKNYLDGTWYSGHMVGGKRHGKGVGTCKYENSEWMLFNGEWIEDKPLGKGEGNARYRNGSRFKGTFFNGKREKGILELTDGRIYSGTFSGEWLHGFGCFIGPQYTYIGNFDKAVGSKGHGVCIPLRLWQIILDLSRKEEEYTHQYEGRQVNGRRDGEGTVNFTDGCLYKGEFRQGKYHGVGTFSMPSEKDPILFKVKFSNGQFEKLLGIENFAAFPDEPFFSSLIDAGYIYEAWDWNGIQSQRFGEFQRRFGELIAKGEELKRAQELAKKASSEFWKYELREIDCKDRALFFLSFGGTAIHYAITATRLQNRAIEADKTCDRVQEAFTRLQGRLVEIHQSNREEAEEDGVADQDPAALQRLMEVLQNADKQSDQETLTQLRSIPNIRAQAQKLLGEFSKTNPNVQKIREQLDQFD